MSENDRKFMQINNNCIHEFWVVRLVYLNSRALESELVVFGKKNLVYV